MASHHKPLIIWLSCINMVGSLHASLDIGPLLIQASAAAAAAAGGPGYDGTILGSHNDSGGSRNDSGVGGGGRVGGGGGEAGELDVRVGVGDIRTAVVLGAIAGGVNYN
jgi:hypothetical protein